MSDELGVGRMIRGLDADDVRFQWPVVLVEVTEEVQLRLGRSHQKDLTVTVENAGDVPKIPVLVVGVVSDPQVDRIIVAMAVRAGRSDVRLQQLVRVDLDDASLFLIHPDDCMLHDELSLITVVS